MKGWGNFFTGLARGTPEGFNMGMAYQRNERDKAAAQREAELHPGALEIQGLNISGEQQEQAFNELHNPTRIEAANLGNTAQGLSNTFAERTMDDRAEALTLGNTNTAADIKAKGQDYRHTETEFGQKQASIAAGGVAVDAELGYTPESPTLQNYLKNPPKDPNELITWKKVNAATGGGLNAVKKLYAQLSDARSKGADPAVLSQVTEQIRHAMRKTYQASSELVQNGAKHVVKNGYSDATGGTIVSATHMLNAGLANRNQVFNAVPSKDGVVFTLYDMSKDPTNPKKIRDIPVSWADLADGDPLATIEAEFVRNMSGEEQGDEAAGIALEGRKKIAAISKDESIAAKNDAAAAAMGGGTTDGRIDPAKVSKIMTEFDASMAQRGGAAASAFTDMDTAYNGALRANIVPTMERFGISDPVTAAVYLMKAAANKGALARNPRTGQMFIVGEDGVSIPIDNAKY